MRGLRREVERLAGIEALLSGLTCNEEALAGGLEGPVEGGEVLEGVLGEDLCLRLLGQLCVDLNSGDHGDKVGDEWESGRDERRTVEERRGMAGRYM